MASRLNTWSSLFFGEALRALFRHKVRSALSAVGITIGVAAVVLVVAMGKASSERAESELHKLGDNLVWVEAGSRTVSGVRSGSHGSTSLTMEDAIAIRDEVKLVKAVSPNIDGSLHLAYGNKSWTTRYRGVSPAYMDIKTWTFAKGASFTQEETDREDDVAVIGQTVRERLFGDADPIGETIRIEKQLFVVVGVLAPKGQTGFGQDQDDTVLLPYTTAEAKIRGGGQVWLDDILCSAVRAEDVNPAVDRIVALLRERHHIPKGGEDDFNIRRPDEVIKVQIETSKTFARLLIVIASISLLVGGIGIMNVMLASVTERTREIGLRLAIGATESAVQIQFLAEGVMLSVLGGLLGVGLSLVSARIIAKVLGWPMAIPPQAFAVALGSSIAVGVFFGFYPARRAARLDPIEALRHE